MTSFDLKKALRWKESLQLTLLDKSLSKAFDAASRIEHRWEESNFPDGTFASENINSANGFINLKIELKRPADDFIEVPDLDRPVVVTVAATAGGFATRETQFPHKKKVPVFNNDNWNAIKDFIGVDDPESFYSNNLANAKDKDAVFHKLLGAEIARNFVAKLQFEVLNETNDSLGTFNVDPTPASRYHRNRSLRVSIKTTGKTNIKRENFHYLKISTSANAPFSALVQSGLMKYKTDHFDGFLFNYQRISDDISKDDPAHIYTGPSQEELRNPRLEDVASTNQLIDHLNDNLEHYHSAIWLKMTPQRRFMLLDGIILNGKGQGRSVASLVENELLTVVGNNLVFPVAPGLNLNPDFGTKESLDDFYQVAVSEPLSISIPTKGVFAESVMGNCNSCEEKDESRFWRWEESPIPDSPTAINPINTDSRRAEPNMQTQQLPNPIVNIQTAPSAPDPTGLAATIGLLGKGDTFRDVTGLELNQKNALAAFQSALGASESLAKEGAKLEIQKTMERRLDNALNKINSSKKLTPEKKSELTEKAITAYLGGGAEKTEGKEEKRLNKEKDMDLNRKVTEKDTQVIKKATDEEQIDKEQGKEMTEDRIREGQGIPKTKSKTKKTINKINLTILFHDYERIPMINASFQLRFGPMIEALICDNSTNGMFTFNDVEIESNRRYPFELLGVPYIERSSFANLADYYYRVNKGVLIKDNVKDYIIEVQEQRKTLTEKIGSSRSKTEVMEEYIKASFGFETGTIAKLLAGKIKASIEGGETETNSDTTGTTDELIWTTVIPRRTLIIRANSDGDIPIDND